MMNVTMLSALIVFQSFCFQTYGALRREIGPVDRDVQYACPWYNISEGGTVYRCCSGYFLENRKCIACPKGSYGYRCARECKCKSHERCDPIYGCKCKPSKWGYHCEKWCSPSCNDIEECDKINGKCRCPPGKWGERCEHHCQCYTHATCDRQTGKCQCEPGWIGDKCTDCDESKVYNTGKKFCTDRCLHCFSSESCSVTDPASCDCTPGWTGSKCDISIPETCDSRFNSDICRNHNDCDDFHGCNVKTCKCYGCIKGYRGIYCNLPCGHGKYGYGCENTCSDDCKSEKCHHITGNCTACAVGYHGENCEEECPDGYYGHNCLKKCQCNDKMCNHKSGCPCGEDCTTMPNKQDPVSNGQHSSTEQIQDSESKINGDLDDMEDHLQLIIGVCVFLVLLILVNVIICVVCHRRGNITVNKRNVHYENADVAEARTDTLAMFGSPSDSEMADVGSRVTTDKTNKRCQTNLKNFDDESNGDEGNRHIHTPEYAQVNKTRTKRKKAILPLYSDVTGNGEISTNQSHNEPGEDSHYYTLEEVEDNETRFTRAQGLSGVMHNSKAVSGGDEWADEEADYNVVDRTGKSYKFPLGDSEPVNYEKIGMGKEDVPTYEDTDYNTLNFGPKRLAFSKE
ncbi:delta-like protein A [Ptychodera flava]|uniref:delta-like protein A n=1 Tax=Ptychodera flava TaxID=63121 RepID=UPI00396A01A3